MFSLDLQPNEKVFKIYRQSEWVLAKNVVIIFVALYLPWFLLVRAEMFANFTKLFLFWTVLVLVYGVYHYLLWMVNSYVVTDHRLIAVNYVSLFKKKVTESPLDRILNVSYSTTGFFSSLLNFGDVEVRVAGLPEPMVLENLRKPQNLKTFLWALQSHKPRTVAAATEE